MNSILKLRSYQFVVSGRVVQKLLLKTAQDKVFRVTTVLNQLDGRKVVHLLIRIWLSFRALNIVYKLYLNVFVVIVVAVRSLGLLKLKLFWFQDIFILTEETFLNPTPLRIICVLLLHFN